MIIQYISSEKKLYIEFDDEPLTREDLDKVQMAIESSLFERNFEFFHFHTHNLRIPPLFLSMAFGRFMMRIQKHMRGKTSIIDAPARIRSFLKFFFAVYKPASKIVWFQ